MGNIRKKISNKQEDFMFIFKWTAIAFFVIHGGFFARRFANEDYLHDFYKSGSVVKSGRFIGGITDVMNPWMIAVIAACIFGVVIFLSIDMLKIKSNFMKILTIFVMVSFPTLATGFGYLFMVQVYSLALLFSVLAVYITDKFEFGFIFGAVFLMLSLGAYQAYIAVSMTLCVIIVLRNWYMDSPRKINKILQFIVMGVMGILLYMFVIKQIYPMFGIVLNNYKGISNMGSINFKDTGYLLSRTSQGVVDFFTGKRFFSFNILQRYCNILMFFMIGYYSIEKMICRRISIYDIIAVGAFVLIPFCMNIVDIIAPQSNSTTLTVYALCLVYILLISMNEWYINDIREGKFVNKNKFNIEAYIVENDRADFENCLFKNKAYSRESKALILKGLTIIVLAITIISNMILSSVYYLKMDKVYEATLLFENRMYSRIEAIEGYDRYTPIAVIASSASYYVHGGDVYPEIIEDTGIWQKYIGFNDLAGTRPSYATDRTIRFINNTLNVGAVGATPKQIDDILKSNEYSRMGVYPSDDGIQMIDGIIVVNFIN